MVPPDSHRITRVLWYSGYKTGGACVFVYGAITRYGPAFQQCSTNTTLCNSLAGLWPCQSCPTTIQAATPIRLHHLNFGLFPVRSPLLRESLLISLPPGTEMFHFPGCALPTLCIQVGVTWLHHAGLPHSEIFGSTLARSSPKLIAAGHVLHRRLMPRHPPYALIRLTIHLLLRCMIQRSSLYYGNYNKLLCFVVSSVFKDRHVPWNTRKGSLTKALYRIPQKPPHGGGERDRTDDILLAKQVLSQLSYTPESWWA